MRLRWTATILFAWALGGCDEMQGESRDHDAGADAYVEPLRLNHIQLRGTVNSAHDWNEEIGLPEELMERGAYRHLPFEEQAGVQGIRQFDLDLYGDQVGAFGLEVISDARWLLDGSICLDFYRCVEALRDWSDQNPGHAPLVLFLGETFNRREPWLWRQFDDVERILSGLFGRGRLISPAEVRGGHPDLMAALEVEGWPTLDEVRGRVMVVLNDRGIHREKYLERGGFDPADRFMFVMGDPQHPDPSEVVFTFDPAGEAALPEIERLSRRGFLVHASTDDAEMVPRLRAAGAQMVATRFPDEVLWSLDEGAVACNPLSAPAHCQPERIEAAQPERAVPDGGVPHEAAQ